jgi:hypothetical protein
VAQRFTAAVRHGDNTDDAREEENSDEDQQLAGSHAAILTRLFGFISGGMALNLEG